MTDRVNLLLAPMSVSIDRVIFPTATSRLFIRAINSR